MRKTKWNKTQTNIIFEKEKCEEFINDDHSVTKGYGKKSDKSMDIFIK